jgi:predicted nicotinamide N-methyase
MLKSFCFSILLTMASPAPSLVTVLVDYRDDVNQLAPLRHRLVAENRQDVVDAVATKEGISSNDLQFLEDGVWLNATAFVASQMKFNARVLRCTVLRFGDFSSRNSVPQLPWRKFGHVTFGTGAATDMVVGPSYHRVKMGEIIRDEQAGFPHGATGRTLWDGAVLLALYLQRHPEVIIGQRVIELGAGLGLVGVCAAIIGAAQVTITDLEYALVGAIDTVNKNIDAIHVPVRIETLDWFNPPIHSDWDVIIAADVVWLTELVDPFVNTLKTLCPPGSRSIVILSYQRRGFDTDRELWRLVEAAGFVVTKLNFDPLAEPRCLREDADAQEPRGDPHRDLPGAPSSKVDLDLFLLSR